jgi:hypothetical protein
MLSNDQPNLPPDDQPPHPFHKLLDQIADIIQFAYDNADKRIPQEKEAAVENQLADIERQVREFKKVNDKLIADYGLTDYIYQTMKEEKGGGALADEQREILARAEELINQAAAASKDLQGAAKDAKAENKTLKKVKKKKEPKLRKSKFRSMGGAKDWKPL